MPYATKEKRAEYNKRRRKRINGDPVLKEKKRQGDRKRYKATMQTEEGRKRIRDGAKKWRDKNPEKVKELMWRHNLKRHYGITPELYFEFLDSQNGVCAICEKEPKAGRRLSVDHDHKSGSIRGLLCDNCNHGIGKFKDRVSFLKAAIAYLDSRPPALGSA